MILFLDLETFNEVDIKYGTPIYAQTAEVLLFSYSIDDLPVRVWDCTMSPDMPSELHLAIESADTLVAHNSFFDRNILRVAFPKFDWSIERWDDTMVRAQVHALPGSLDDLCRVLDVPSDLAKIADGEKLIQLFCKPQAANRKVRRATSATHPEQWSRFIEYAVNDIEAMRYLYKTLPTWNWTKLSQTEWRLDQTINDRGFAVDTELVSAGANAAVKEKDILAKRFFKLSQGLAPTQRAKVLAYLNQTYGLSLTGTSAEQLLPLIANHANEQLVEMGEIILAANRSSTAKYKALKPMVSADGRMRGSLVFAGAGRTRRWSGRGFQPQNLPSRGLPPSDEVEAYIGALKADCHDLMFDNLMLYGSASLRGAIIAPEGFKLVVSDLSNIEGRMLSWVAGEEWKLEAFREFDAGHGADLYNITAASILGGSPFDVSKKNRNVFGKVPDLSSGYAGGVSGYQTFAKAYHVRMADHMDTITQNLGAFLPKAEDNFSKWGEKQSVEMDISREEWIASETCKLAWRDRHPATVKFWYAIGDAVKQAINVPDTIFKINDKLNCKVVTHCDHKWLLISLPSGRFLTYFEPEIDGSGNIRYMGRGTEDGGVTTAGWVKLYTHGGKLTGNCLTGDTLVATFRGWVPLEKVKPSDKVWDGHEWVTHGGMVCQGLKKVGKWCGIRVTGDHLILVGSEWLPAREMGESTTDTALRSAQCSGILPWATPLLARTDTQTACVNAVQKNAHLIANSSVTNHFGADGAYPNTNQTSLQISHWHSLIWNSLNAGAVGIGGWLGDVLCQIILHTKTTVLEVFQSMNRGSKIGLRFLSGLNFKMGGIKQTWTWIVLTITEAITPTTYAWYPVQSTPTIGDQTSVLNTLAIHTPMRNLGVSFSRNGEVQMLLRTTSRQVEASNGLWVGTTTPEKVYDLMDVGHRHQFMVLTNSGPVIVHNCCQSLARDVLAFTLPIIESFSYRVEMLIHDEVITECPDTPDYNVTQLSELLSTVPPWATGLPLAAAGFETKRYYKG